MKKELQEQIDQERLRQAEEVGGKIEQERILKIIQKDVDIQEYVRVRLISKIKEQK
jgi:hypothetical protein